MALTKYIKSPIAGSMPQYVDSEFRKVESVLNGITAALTWNNIDFLNGFQNYDSTQVEWGVAQYAKDKFGFVHLRGLIKDGTDGASAFTLPDDCRPQKHHMFAQIGHTGSVYVLMRVDVRIDGGVYIISTTSTPATQFVSLHGISFYVGDRQI